VFGVSARKMEEGGSYARDYKGLWCMAMLTVTAYTRRMFGPVVSLFSQCPASALGPPRVVYCIICHIRTVRGKVRYRQDEMGEITTLVIVNLNQSVRLLDLWFKGIPGVVQSTEYAISNHPLLHCSIFNIELQKGNNANQRVILYVLNEIGTLSGCNLAMALVYRILT
jgi:hypothetical protein